MSRKTCHDSYPHRRRTSGNGGGDNRHCASLAVDSARMQCGMKREGVLYFDLRGL